MLNVGSLVAYLAALEANNNKTWFDANKPRYQALRREFTDVVQEVILTVTQDDESLEGLRAESCLFRINRDLRFAKDKSPYKSNFSAALGAQVKSGPAPGYYFEVTASGRWGTAAGMWMPEFAHATLVRNAIVAQPERVTAILDDPELRSAFPGGLMGESYKRPPKGFGDDAPRLDLLKMKSYALWNDGPVADSMSADDLVALVSRAFRAAVPWQHFLRQALRLV